MIRSPFYRGPSPAILHETYAKGRMIDDQAPVASCDEIVINADTREVGSILADIDSWPTFNPLFNEVYLESSLAVDKTALLKLKGFQIRVTFAVVDPERELIWTGVALGARAIDRFLLEKISANMTKLHLQEFLAGAIVPLFSSRARLREQHMTSLKSFKKKVESAHLG
jgi:hypothetical protein